MEITEPVILDLAQGRKHVRLELTTRADARDLMKAVERCMERLPDDGEGLLALVEVRELPEVVESTPIPQSHYCDTGNCEVCGDGTGDVPVSADLLGQLAASIITGRSIVVDDEPDKVPVPIGLCGHPVTPGAWSQGFATCRDCLSDTTPNGVALYDRATAGEQLPTAAPSTPRPLRTVTLALVPGAARSDSDVIPALQVPCPEAHPTNGTLCEGKIPHPMPHRDPNGAEWSTEPPAGAL